MVQIFWFKYIWVQMREGPEPLMVTGWAQILPCRYFCANIFRFKYIWVSWYKYILVQIYLIDIWVSWCRYILVQIYFGSNIFGSHGADIFVQIYFGSDAGRSRAADGDRLGSDCFSWSFLQVKLWWLWQLCCAAFTQYCNIGDVHKTVIL